MSPSLGTSEDLTHELDCKIAELHLKGELYRIWCGVNRLGDTSAFVIPAGQLLLTRRGKTRMYTVGIVFEFYTEPL